jgi:hypothetical protein
MKRPQSIAEIAERTLAGAQDFDPAVREFVDTWQFMTTAARPNSIRMEPAQIGPLEDAYLAALAEHLALGAKISAPDWTEQPQRFLREPFFAGGLESLKPILLVESPLAFRRRLIFISADGLSRPHHPMVDAAG